MYSKYATGWTLLIVVVRFGNVGFQPALQTDQIPAHIMHHARVGNEQSSNHTSVSALTVPFYTPDQESSFSPHHMHIVTAGRPDEGEQPSQGSTFECAIDALIIVFRGISQNVYDCTKQLNTVSEGYVALTHLAV